MIEIVWDEKWRKKHPDLVNSFRVKMELFTNNPFHPILKTHSLSGILKGLWSLRISYDYRLIFRFVDKEKMNVLLINIETHEEVY